MLGIDVKKIAREITEEVSSEIAHDIGIDEMLKLLKTINKSLVEIKELLGKER